MFSWLRRKPASTISKPATSKANPGVAAKGRVDFTRDSETWSEEIDLIECAARVLTQWGHRLVRYETWLEHPDSGFTIQPLLVDFQPLDDGGVRTVTTIEVSHPTLTEQGVFEYQHATGQNMEDAIRQGFDQWVQTDFIALLDATRPKPENCMMLEMSLPAKGNRPALTRRAVLGPVAHFTTRGTVKPDGSHPSGDEEHPFCPCCLLTSTREGFTSLIETDRFFGLRLFALRDENGVQTAG